MAGEKTRVSNVIDYSLTRNYLQLRKIVFISCKFGGLRVIGETSISRDFQIISQNFTITMRNERNFYKLTSKNLCYFLCLFRKVKISCNYDLSL